MDPLPELQTDPDSRSGTGGHLALLAALGCVILCVCWFAVIDMNKTRTLPTEHQVFHYYPVDSSARAEQAIQAAENLRKRLRSRNGGSLTHNYANSPGFITLMGLGLNEKFFFPSDSERAQDFYGGRWAANNIHGSASGTQLIVRKDDNPAAPYSMAEFRTHKFFGFGRYEAIMQPAKGSGLVSAFFTYTGPYAGDPHDEIDIEFLGKDTTKVHFNYFRNGRKGNFASFDLPFDAAEAPHLYAFEWTPGGLTWFVDGEAYYHVPANDPRMPRAPGRIYLSTWTGVKPMQQWHGKPTFQSGSATLVSCVSFRPLGFATRSCADVYTPHDAYRHEW